MKVHGSTYEGEFGEDKKSGYGKMAFATGEIYEGDWRDDVQSTSAPSQNRLIVKGRDCANLEVDMHV
jgi:hypothetical protein